MSSNSSIQNIVKEKKLPRGSETYQIVVSEVMSEKMLADLRHDDDDDVKSDTSSENRQSRRRNTIASIKGLRENKLSVLATVKTATDAFRKRNSIAFGSKCPLVESDDDA